MFKSNPDTINENVKTKWNALGPISIDDKHFHSNILRTDLVFEKIDTEEDSKNKMNINGKIMEVDTDE